MTKSKLIENLITVNIIIFITTNRASDLMSEYNANIENVYTKNHVIMGMMTFPLLRQMLLVLVRENRMRNIVFCTSANNANIIQGFHVIFTSSYKSFNHQS